MTRSGFGRFLLQLPFHLLDLIFLILVLPPQVGVIRRQSLPLIHLESKDARVGISFVVSLLKFGLDAANRFRQSA